MARRLWHHPIISLSTTDEMSDSEAAETLKCHRKPLKLGKLHTADSMVLKKVTWLRELVYTTTGQSKVYEDMPGYRTVMEMVTSSIKPFMAKHRKEVIADAEVYGWVPVRAYHAVWLQQIENGIVQWAYVDAKLEFRRVLVWHSSQIEVQPKSVAGKGAGSKNTQEGIPTAISAKPGPKVCVAFNKAGCRHQEDYPADLHIFTLCLSTVNRQCAQAKRFCNRKQYAGKKLRCVDGVCQTHLPMDNDSERIMNKDNKLM